MTRPRAAAVLGRAIDAAGRALDGAPSLPQQRAQPRALTRVALAAPFWTSVPAIDALLPLGRGARVGIFGPAGCGKTTLLETIVANARAHAVVLALVGERGREAQRWISSRLPHVVAVVATAERPAAERAAAAERALDYARELAADGLDVLFVLDSLARYVDARRDVAIAAGEPMGRGGYPPSAFAAAARLLEGAGAFAAGSVTMLATVLCESDEDPLAHAMRSLLDGHLVLAPALAHRGAFPAIDLLASASRTFHDVAASEHVAAAARIRGALATLAETADARALGVPVAPEVAALAALEPAFDAFRFRSGPVPPGRALHELAALADMVE